MLENKLKQALKEDRAVFGIGITAPMEVPVLRVLANAGVEWLFMDLEHGSADISDMLTPVQVADMLGMSAVLRIPNLEYPWVARSLDTGALSIMIPRVETKEQAEFAIRCAKFPPAGIRGMGSPSQLSYAAVSAAQAAEISNRETLIVLQIETVKAVENVEEIASVAGVDVLFIGPLDMSISLGKPGAVASDESHALFRHVCHVARQRELAVGIVCRADQVGFYYQMGIRMFSIGSVLSLLQAGIQQTAAEFKRQLPQ